ncbi:MAG: hypothetical protein HY079_13550 [Elusimicrobia bacterium]|nr:hypothetical protein [Elusimicrobiota bacterium]
MSRALLLAAVLAAPAAAAPRVVSDGLETMKRWTVYDDAPAGALDLARLCRAAYLPCGLVVRAGEDLSVPAAKVGGENAYDLLQALLAAHPGYRARFSQGTLTVEPEGDRCAAALERPLKRRWYDSASPPAVAADALAAAGLAAVSAQARALTLDAALGARYKDLQFEVRRGATARQVLDGVAATDGWMMWTLTSAAGPAGEPCARFSSDDWRKPQAVAGPPKRGWAPNDWAGRRSLPSRAEVAPPPPVMLESPR